MENENKTVEETTNQQVAGPLKQQKKKEKIQRTPIENAGITFFILMIVTGALTVLTVAAPVTSIILLVLFYMIMIILTIVTLGAVLIAEGPKEVVSNVNNFLLNLVDESTKLLALAPYFAIVAGTMFVVSFIINLIGMRKDKSNGCKGRFIATCIIAGVVILFACAILIYSNLPTE